MLFDPLKKDHLPAGFLVHLGCPGDLGDPALKDFQVGKDKLQVDRLDIAHRIHRTVDMDYILILEAPDDMDDRVHFADIGQELVAQAFTLGGALHEACDVDEFNDCRRHFFGMVQFAQALDPVVRDRDDPYVGVDRAEGVVGRFRAGLGK